MRPTESPESSLRYISAVPGPDHSVIYTDASGKRWQYSGGTRPWRNQNPGNLVVGNVSKRNGAIGKAGGFAIFPDYEAGHAALIDSLKNSHGKKTIPRLMEVYAPSSENETKKYIAFVRKKTGVKGNKKVKDFTRAEFEKLWQAIEKMEGWGKEGKISEYEPGEPKGKITAVRKDKSGTIQAYQIEGYGWVSKSIAISLALESKVDAVVATSPRGNQFLRARPNSETYDNLKEMG